MSAESDSQTQLGIVTMYKKDGCPYCKNATALLEEKYGLKITFVDINGDQK
jgi:glutaredoxin